MKTNFPEDPLLDMLSYVGQRSCTFKFMLYDFTTGRILRELKPYRESVPTLSHDTSRTIPRQVSNLFFNADDTAALNTVGGRLQIFMIFEGREPYPLGTYLFVDQARIVSTGGLESTVTAVDSMFIVDQELEKAYSAGTYDLDGNIVAFKDCEQAAAELLAGLPINFSTEHSPFYTIGVWSAGTNRGSALGDVATDGDYFPPWFDHDNVMRFIRSFDPFAKIPDFDLDTGFRVNRDSITLVDDILTAPNRFKVISNGSASEVGVPVVGVYDVPASAPHSIANRGFVIPRIIDRQIDTAIQATVVAKNIGLQQTLFETVEFETPPDPRHDSYNVFFFLGTNWLEISWSMELVEGGRMRHVGRKAYR